MDRRDCVPREVLPIPDRKPVGLTTDDAKDPDTKFPPIRPLRPPTGAPNVLIVLLDDVGFGASSAFGGPCRTPNAERLAATGLKYTRFHTTALCSPTRAALLSGRNHHAVGMGGITEIATSAPGYNSMRPNTCAPLAEILKLNGYSTAQFGKCHEVPVFEATPIGPYDHWPTGSGFEHFYGFIGGENNQYYPELYDGTTPIEPPRTPEEGYHLMEDLADKAIGYIHQQKAIAPDKPFFVYFAPGATHAPHHVPQDWIAKYKGQFDQGWDKLREETFARQRTLGIIPPDCELTKRPEDIPAWDTMEPRLRPVLAREMEIYAAFLELADHHFGRVIDSLADMGILDETPAHAREEELRAEGSLTGTLNNMKTQLGLLDDVSFMLKHIDEIGGPLHENHYPVAWCWAGSSPFQWMKQVASHFGGTRNGLVLSWPKGITDRGGLRSQFHHCIDLAPTILEVAGIPEPREVNGVPQKLIEGISMAYTFADKDAPGRRVTQYFEMLGNRAIYHDGWIAGCLHGRLPWLTSGGASFDKDSWELYNIEEDFSQANDLAAKEPQKLRELQDRFMAEAAKYNVLPLDDRFAQRADPNLHPSHIRGKTQFVYAPGTIRLGERSAPNTKNVHHTLAAEVEIPQGSAEGVLVCCGGISGGFSLFIKDGKLHWEHNYYNEVHYRASSTDTIPPGHHVVSAEVKVDKQGKFGTGGAVTLRLDKKKIGEGRFEQQVAGYFTVNETFDVGCDTVSPVSDLYQSPFAFTGTILRVMVDITEASFEDLAAQHEMRARLAMATQ
jgi:arylsulfatase A-like enzyme